MIVIDAIRSAVACLTVDTKRTLEVHQIFVVSSYQLDNIPGLSDLPDRVLHTKSTLHFIHTYRNPHMWCMRVSEETQFAYLVCFLVYI